MKMALRSGEDQARPWIRIEADLTHSADTH